MIAEVASLVSADFGDWMRQTLAEDELFRRWLRPAR